MKLRVLGLVGLAVCLCLTSAVSAQEGQRQRRGGGMFGGMMGGMGGMGGRSGGLGPAFELLGMLRMEEVRKEISVSDDDYKAIQDALPNMRELFGMDEDKRKQVGQDAADLLDEMLSPDQQDRLMGLLVQQRGTMSVMNAMIAKKIGMTEGDIEKLKEKLEELRASMQKENEGTMREMMSAAREGGNREGMREKMMEIFKKAGDDLNKGVSDALSDGQRKKLEALKGEKFEFPEQRGFGRGGAGRGGAERGQGNPFGRGGRGGRGGDRPRGGN